MATHIGRISRWAGATGNNWWSVLHHCFLVELIVSDMTEDKKIRVRDAARLYALLHDLHEAYTGDIPTPFKDKPVREFQQHTDRLLYIELRIPAPNRKYHSLVKAADLRAMYAEAVAFHDPYCWLDPAMYDEALANVHWRDVAHVKTLLKAYGSHTQTTSAYSRGVQDYVREVSLGVANVNRLTLDGYTGPTSYIRDVNLDVPPFIPNPYEEGVA